MKILQIVSSLGNGGAEKLVVELSNELSKSNEVILVSLKAIQPWMYPPRRINTSVKLISLNKKRRIDFLVIYKLFKTLRKENPDVVHIHLSLALLYSIFLIPFVRRINFFYTIHSEITPHLEKSFIKYIYLPFFSRITFICLTEEIKNKFIIRFPKLVFKDIPNGICNITTTEKYINVKEEIDSIRLNKETKIILFIGRFYYQKNIPLLLNVFDSIKELNVRLVLLGKGEPEIEEILIKRTNEKDGNIFYLGSKENIGDYINNADALILTSRYEGLPLVVLEALSCGLIVLSTPVPGILNIIKDGENGFISKSQTSADIIQIIDSFIKLDNQEIKRISANNLKLYIDEYSIEICANKHKLLYDEFIKKRSLSE